MIELRELTTEDETAFEQYVHTWTAQGEHIVPEALDPSNNDFKNLLVKLKADKSPTDEIRVPATMLFYFKDDTTIIGVAHVRHSLNDALKLYGGHIGYGVAPGLRGNGFATEILKDALQFLKSLNETRALITCDEDNYASVNVILNNGGIEAEPHTRDDGNLTRRFWIDINNN